MSRSCACLVAALLAAAFAAPSATARSRHHYDVMPARKASPPARGRQFYPEEVENGVRGNLPFNNQMRKFSDPLNANGAGG